MDSRRAGCALTPVAIRQTYRRADRADRPCSFERPSISLSLSLSLTSCRRSDGSIWRRVRSPKNISIRLIRRDSSPTGIKMRRTDGRTDGRTASSFGGSPSPYTEQLGTRTITALYRRDRVFLNRLVLKAAFASYQQPIHTARHESRRTAVSCTGLTLESPGPFSAQLSYGV